MSFQNLRPFLLNVFIWVLLLLVIKDHTCALDGIEESGDIVHQSGKKITTSNHEFEGSIHNESLELDLGTCPSNTQVPCAATGTCVSIPLLEPIRCRRRYCPYTKVYCLDFDGCMIPDPVFIYSLSAEETKCPIPLSLCANKNECQYVLRKNYDDIREPSVSRLNCSLMTKQIVFKNSSCSTHNDCHWTSKCCSDEGLNRQCVAYNGTILPARLTNEESNDTSTLTTLSSPNANSTPPLTSEPRSNLPANGTNSTKSIVIRMQNDFSAVVEGKVTEFESSMRKQLAEVLAISVEAFSKVKARNGSVLLDVEMTPPHPSRASEIDQAYSKLATLLKNGSLVLSDLNGTQLSIPPQANGELVTNETNTAIIISVTAASLGTTLLLILWILWNNKNNKAINPLASHLERIGSRSVLRTRLSTDNLIGNNRDIPNDQFAAFSDPQVQWEIFQKSFNKPGYVWHSQDEGVWTGIDHQAPWPQLNAPDEESVPIPSYNPKAVKERKQI